MRVTNLMDVLLAFHLSYYVESPISDRGGIALVAPPGNWKSTCITTAYKGLSNVIRLSDINAQTLSALHQDIAAGLYHTIAMGDFEKLYDRNPATAINAEGQLKAMIAQGFRAPSFSDHRLIGIPEAKCGLVIGVIPSVYSKKITNWIENGFARRIIWCNFQLDNARLTVDCIHDWKRQNLSFDSPINIPTDGIKMKCSLKQSKQIEGFISEQYDLSIPLLVMKRLFAVLSWKHKSEKRAMDILEDFAEGLGGSRARLTI